MKKSLKPFMLLFDSSSVSWHLPKSAWPRNRLIRLRKKVPILTTDLLVHPSEVVLQYCWYWEQLMVRLSYTRCAVKFQLLNN